MRLRIIAGLALSALLTGPALAAPPAPKPDAVARDAWATALGHIALPQGGCFAADYPTRAWRQVACKAAPNRPYPPRTGHRGYTVGDGTDYAAAGTGLTSTAVGSFPAVTGVTSERGSSNNKANTFSIQLNSDFFTTTVCNGATNPSSCLGWQQFVYSNSGVAFMQYWLINYGSHCPTGGWMADSGDCYRNSAGVDVPKQKIAQLASLAVTGSAVVNGTDRLTFTTAGSAYSTTGNDSVVKLANAWQASEYNIVGDGDGSAAKFNAGSSITVKIALTDGSTAKPTCESNAGTTGETNNLTLQACTAVAGASPSISFVESR